MDAMKTKRFVHTVGYIFRNGNGTEITVVAYLDCIHELVSITFIVFV